MREDAWKTYESWRGLWLSGGDSNAIGALRFHGLRGALAVAGAACGSTGRRPAPPSSIKVELPIADAVIAEAASQVRRLLCVSLPLAGANIVRGDEENRYA